MHNDPHLRTRTSKMKFLLGFVFLTISLALGEGAGRCSSSDDCDADECCISGGPRWWVFRKARCEKLAQKGEKCSEEHEAHGFLDQQYDHHCPCAEGLSCEPKETRFGIRFNERCVDDSSRTTQTTTESPVTPTEAETTTQETDTPEPETEAPVPETEAPAE